MDTSRPKRKRTETNALSSKPQVISERPRHIKHEYKPCDECIKRKMEHKRCGLIFEDSVFECDPCNNWKASRRHESATPPGPCSFVKKEVRLFATDFYFTHSIFAKENFETCKTCEEYCTHEACKQSNLKRRQCQHEDAIFGWCAVPEKHKHEWDYEQQPGNLSEDQMRYLYLEKPYENVAPWSPLYVRKAMETEGLR